jgi:hypothetical protein
MSQYDDELQPIADRLRAERPELTALELDEISQRVRARVAARKRPRSAFMKSRLTILAMLVAGILLSTTGAGLAISGSSSRGDAGVAQYGTPTPTSTPAGNVLGEEESGGGGTTNTPSTPSTPSTPTNETQPAQQVEAGSGNSLPFTGYAALPILIGGVALLGGGLVLRYRARDERS